MKRRAAVLYAAVAALIVLPAVGRALAPPSPQSVDLEAA